MSNWRLPAITDAGALGYDAACIGTDCGYNVGLSTSEMAHLQEREQGRSAPAHFSIAHRARGPSGQGEFDLG